MKTLLYFDYAEGLWVFQKQAIQLPSSLISTASIILKTWVLHKQPSPPNFAKTMSWWEIPMVELWENQGGNCRKSGCKMRRAREPMRQIWGPRTSKPLAPEVFGSGQWFKKRLPQETIDVVCCSFAQIGLWPTFLVLLFVNVLLVLSFFLHCKFISLKSATCPVHLPLFLCFPPWSLLMLSILAVSPNPPAARTCRIDLFRRSTPF